QEHCPIGGRSQVAESVSSTGGWLLSKSRSGGWSSGGSHPAKAVRVERRERPRRSGCNLHARDLRDRNNGGAREAGLRFIGEGPPNRHSRAGHVCRLAV